jgi:hypothetical protein
LKFSKGNIVERLEIYNFVIGKRKNNRFEEKMII